MMRQTHHKHVDSGAGRPAQAVDTEPSAEDAVNEPLLCPADTTSDPRNMNMSIRRGSNKDAKSAADSETECHMAPSPVPRPERDVKVQSSSDCGQQGSCHWMPSAKRILQGWWQEILCSIVSIAALILLIGVLRAFDGKPLPDLPYINIIVAVLSTAARTAFVIPVVEGLSQCKWIWFRKPRAMQDFALFDQASRGPWGSLILLFRAKVGLVEILSAFLFISSIATSAFTQSAVAYPSRNISLSGEGQAVAWRIPSTDGFSSDPVDVEAYSYDPAYVNETSGPGRSFPMLSGLLQGVFSSATAPLSFKEPRCLTANCTWPRFSTLAVCHDIKNITHLISASVQSGPTLSYNNTLENATIMNFFAMQWSKDDLPESRKRGPRALEILLYLCVDTYDVIVENNVLSMDRVFSHTEFHVQELLAEDNTTFNVIQFTTPADEGTQYSVPEFWPQTIGNGLRRLLDSHPMGREQADYLSASYMLTLADVAFWRRQKVKATGEHRVMSSKERDDCWWDAANGIAQNIGTSLTNSLLNDESRYPWMSLVNGTAWEREVYVQVRWEWLTLLAVQVLLAAVLLVIVITKTAAADIDIIKSSALVSFFAIGADEKARLQQLAAEGQPIVGEADDRLLFPGAVGGQLHKENEKWVLRSMKT